MEKTCICGKVFTKPVNESLKNWNNRHKYCSKACMNKYKSNAHLKEYQFKKGEHPSPLTEFKKGEIVGDKNNLWKGDNAKYTAKHMWIYYHYGKANKCENCGIEGLKYEWHNINKEYKRDINDWKMLCIPCHKLEHKFIN